MNEIVESNTNEVVEVAGNGVMALRDVNDLKGTAHTSIGDSRVTSIAQQVLDYDPEAMIWQDSPAPLAIMMPSMVKWFVITILWIAGLMYMMPSTPGTTQAPEAAPVTADVKNVNTQASKGKQGKAAHKPAPEEAKASAAVKTHKAQDDTAYTLTLTIGLLVLAFQLFSHGARFLRLKNIHYKMSSQRLAIESGIFSKAVNTYELHQLQNGQVYKPWNLRLFGRENLYVSGLWLTSIANAEAVRDLIRNAGQIEASRIEKARFR